MGVRPCGAERARRDDPSRRRRRWLADGAVGDRRRSARRRRSNRERRRASVRSRRRRHGPAVAQPAMAHGTRRATAVRRTRGLRLHLLHALLPRAPAAAVGGALTPIGSISLLTLPGDHDTWSVTIFVATGDQPLK